METRTGRLYTQLVDERDSIVNALKPNARPKLQGEWAKFLSVATKATTRDGGPTPTRRLSHAVGVLPGFAGETTAGVTTPEPTIHVLAPVEFSVEGKAAIRHFPDGDSKNTNGNSVLLRMDCGDVRVLLTGDLNTHSQHSLLEDYRGSHDAFECDVAKACHHGSGDVSFRFLEKMDALVTVISSGDSEGHDHPRPEIIAASAASGHQRKDGDRLVTPLIYCTEIARSVGLGRIDEVTRLDAGGNVSGLIDPTRLRATAKVVKAGDRAPATVHRRLKNARLATSTVYGLINVRTDGKKILCAALNEKTSTWNVEELRPKRRTVG